MGIKKELSRSKFLALLFLLSTAFFIWQHALHLSWDFTVYAENARYWSGTGSYYETSRPPLAPFVFLMLSFLGAFAEQVFIVLVSIFFLYSTIRLAGKLKISRELFYLFSLSPMVMFYGMINGTELLSLALLELFLVYLLDKKPHDARAHDAFGVRWFASGISGIFLGLAFLTRYNFLIFLPLVFSNRHPKRILATLGLFALTLIPWLAFNFLTTGNMLTSLADSYALNFKYRSYFSQPFSFSHLFMAISCLLPLFAAGVFTAIRTWHVKEARTIKFFCREKANILLLSIFLLSIYQYAATPSKELRYLFPAALPVAYFSSIAADEIRKRSKHLFLAIVSVIILLNLALFAAMNINAYDSGDKYRNAVKTMQEKGIGNCRTLSNAWPILNYLGKAAEPFPRKELVNRTVAEGNFVLIFYSIKEPEWANNSFLHAYPVIHENNDFIVLGHEGACMPERVFNHTYLSLLLEKLLLVHNVSINTNPCFMLFGNYDALEKGCNLVNGKGFTADGNREDGLHLVRD